MTGRSFPIGPLSAPGGPATIADGSDIAEGATTDAAVTTDVNSTLSGKLRGLVKILSNVWDSVNGRLKVDGSAVTQPVSAASLPLPAGAATEATLALVKAKTDNLDVALSTRTKPADAQLVKEQHPGTVTITAADFTTFNDTTRNVALVAANTARRSLVIRNDTDLKIPISEGGVASPTSYSDVLEPKATRQYDYPISTLAINGFFSRLPDYGNLIMTERS